MGIADRAPGIATRFRCAMTERSVPTQVGLTILPSLALAPCSACLRSILIEGRGLRLGAKGRSRGRGVTSARSQHRPGDPCCLGGLRHYRHLHRPLGENAPLPFCRPIVARAGVAHERRGAEGEQLAQPALALPADAFRSPLAGGGVSRGVIPAQAAKSRAQANCRPSPIATTTDGPTHPTPGMALKRRIVGSALAIVLILSSMASIAGVRLSSWAADERLRKPRILAPQARGELGEAAPALRRDNPELSQHRPKAVHKLRALLDEQLARALKRPRRLLLLALDRNRAHVRPPGRNADRGRIARVGLVALHERLHIGRRDPSCPIARSARPQ